MTLKEGINVEKLYSLMKSDEYLFGNKRIILIEQLSCEKNKKIRAKISNEKFIALVTDAAKKISKGAEKSANWVVFSPAVADAINNMTVDDYMQPEMQASVDIMLDEILKSGHTENL